MSESKEPEKILVDGSIFRVKKPDPESQPQKALLLLHGHLGNENVMWILADPLPKNYFILAPRAPIQLGENQFSWHKITPQWPDFDHYGRLAENLLEKVRIWEKENGLQFEKYDLMGFSQGAVMAYALALLFPEKIGKVAALAGFIPASWKNDTHQPLLSGKTFFVAHGKKDEIVPIEKAQQTVSWLENHGAVVEFCEADIGHKISANCFSGLGEFFG